ATWDFALEGYVPSEAVSAPEFLCSMKSIARETRPKAGSAAARDRSPPGQGRSTKFDSRTETPMLRDSLGTPAFEAGSTHQSLIKTLENRFCEKSRGRCPARKGTLSLSLLHF